MYKMLEIPFNNECGILFEIKLGTLIPIDFKIHGIKHFSMFYRVLVHLVFAALRVFHLYRKLRGGI